MLIGPFSLVKNELIPIEKRNCADLAKKLVNRFKSGRVGDQQDTLFLTKEFQTIIVFREVSQLFRDVPIRFELSFRRGLVEEIGRPESPHLRGGEIQKFHRDGTVLCNDQLSDLDSSMGVITKPEPLYKTSRVS